MSEEFSVRIQEADFDLAREYQRLREDNPGAGSVVTFTGLVREIETGRGAEEPIDSMTLEHYPELTESLIREIVEESVTRWNILAVTVIHRVGKLLPRDQIVFVGVAAAHRGESFAAAQYIMDYLKTRATLWKKVSRDGVEHWVDDKASDQQAATRWQRDER